MKIGKLQTNTVFKRALTKEEKNDFCRVMRQAKDTINGGNNDAKSILIVHEPCLPQEKSADIGIGHLTSPTSDKFFDFAKKYLGINVIEVLPPGEVQYHKIRYDYLNTYNGSGLSLGVQGIDLELLTTPEGKSLLTKQDLNEVVDENKTTQKDGFVNYELAARTQSKIKQALKKAYNNFKALNNEDKAEFEEYKTQNDDWLDKKAVYFALKIKNEGKPWQQWEENEKTLYSNVNVDKLKIIEDIKQKYADDIEFYKFKQFLAEEHLKIGRKKLNDKDMKLFGDCLIGFSEDEVWAYGNAFKKDDKGNVVYVGAPEWRIPALNYEEITKENSEAQKLLKKKVSLFAKRYDGIRFDCSWAYVSPKLSDNTVFDFNGKLLNIIEDTVKQVKGDTYNPKDLIHEFEADPKDFSIFDKSGKIKSFLDRRVKVISSVNMSDTYGTTYAMRTLGANPDSFVIGVGNHDPQPLRQIANNIPENVQGKNIFRKAGQVSILTKLFGKSYNEVNDPKNFVKYKFADPMINKNNMVFYMDVFGRNDRFDSQLNPNCNNYSQRIPANYEEAYLDAVESGYGYNPMDALAKVFEVTGLSEKFTALYGDIVKYAKIIAEKSPKS